MGELKHTDVSETTTHAPENYKEIKPEKEMTSKELNNAVSDEFNKVSEVVEKDDNGVKFREGDNLLPNKEFEVNGYKYKTDSEGRIVEASGKLRIEPKHDRDMENVRAKEGQEYKNTDDRGHLIAHRFGGSDHLENLVPMDSELNQHGDYQKLENTLADALKDGAKVDLKVEPIYEGDSTRPSEFRMTYSIDGEKEVAVFKNESEAKS